MTGQESATSGYKILIVSGTPPPYSGPEVMTAQLLRSPLKDWYRIIHYDISKRRDAATKARFDWINILYGLVQPLRLFWLVIRHRPDLIYTNLAQNLGGFLRYASFILIGALFRRPVVVRVMGDGFNHFYERSNPVFRWLIRHTLKRIDRFILRAEALKQQFSNLVPPHKLSVVYSGIDTMEFDRARDGAADGVFRVLFVGYLTKAKGALDLLQAVPLVAERFPQVKFQLMGERLDVERNITYIENPQSNELALEQLLARKGVAEYVELLGVRAGEEKIATFTNADVFVLPSYSEAFPTVVLEAMAAGLPIVATPVGALPEVFDERSILFVEPGNILGLAEGISCLLENDGRRAAMGAYNREIVREFFDLKSHAAGMDRIFSEILNGLETSREQEQ